MKIENEILLGLYRKMLLTRAMEEKHVQLLTQSGFFLSAHLGTGQEAVAIGVTGPLRKEDLLFGTHRGVGEYIGKGMSPKDIWLEYWGKRDSPCKGKGLLHLADRKNGVAGLVASLGSDFPMAVGTALAAKMQKLDQVTLYFVGEGTCNQADAHPSMIMAALWKVPVVFAICNNQFCEMAYMSEHYPTEDVAIRATGYNIPYEIVDGQDIEVTYSATKKAVEHARIGKGPYLVEYKTFRMAPHFSGEPGGYVKKEDLDKWAKRDPIDLCKKKLLERGAITEASDRKLREEVAAEVAEAVEIARQASDPTVDDLFSDVYADKGVIS